MEGILEKWTNYLQFWKVRRFTIRGPILSYYLPEEENSKKPKRRMFLGLTDIIECDTDENFMFEIDTGAEHYYLKAKDLEEKQKWLKALKNGKILGEKLIRESNKNLMNSKNMKNSQKSETKEKSEKFEKFKKIYNEKIKNMYKNIKPFQVVIKQFDSLIKYIEGKSKLEIYKVIYVKNTKNNNTNKKEGFTKTKNNKKIQKIKINTNLEYGRLSHVVSNKIKNEIEELNLPQRLTTSINNFTEKGYFLKGEEFFDMDLEEESFASIKNLGKESDNDLMYKSQTHFNNKNYKKIIGNKIKTSIQQKENSNIINANEKPEKLGKTSIVKGEYYDPLYDYKRRTSLPVKYKDTSFNILKIIKNLMGKDLSNFSLPIFLNEPLSMLQKICENFQYAELLNKAAKEQNQYFRLGYVACFNIGGLVMNIHRAKNLLNPLLFETFEYVDNELNYRFIAEEVSISPPIAAFYAEGKGWNISSNNTSKVSISLTGGVEAICLENTYVTLTDFNDEIVYTKPKCRVRNVLTEPTLDYTDKFMVKNNEGDECIINMIPYCETKKVGVLNGEIKDIEGNIVFKIEGNWYDKIKIINSKTNEEKIIWEIIKSSDKDYYFFQPYTFDLNNLTEEMRKSIPKTDSRFRKDERFLEEQKMDEAEAERERIEEKMRKKIKEDEKNGVHPKPRFFEETYDDITGELIYRYKGNYFDDRKNNKMKDLPDLF